MQAGKPWIQVYSGVAEDLAFDYEHPDRFTWPVPSIAHHLSQLNRYTGAARSIYSVAEHSVRVGQYARDLVQVYWQDDATRAEAMLAAERAGQMHDAVEMAIGDVNSPLKSMPFMAEFKAYEKGLHAMVAARFDLKRIVVMHRGKEYDVVTSADITALEHERRALLGKAPGGWKRYDVLPSVPSVAFDARSMGWTAAYAERAFLDACARLGLR